jgi:hypothetical protein
MSPRYIEPDDVREDPPDDPPEDFAHGVHTCGWNGSLRQWRGEHGHAPSPCPMPVRERLDAIRAACEASAAAKRARGLCL